MFTNRGYSTYKILKLELYANHFIHKLYRLKEKIKEMSFFCVWISKDTIFFFMMNDNS